jgi:3-oxoacyl-[acyl-carrier-protein] synthase-3
VFANVERYGNTSAASIPVALCEAVDAGLVQAGSTVVMSGFGAGLSWGTAVWQWHG